MKSLKVRLTDGGFMKMVMVGVLAVGLAPVAVACSQGAPPVSGPEISPEKTVVEMTDQLRFSPDRVSIKVGDTVTWRNSGTVAHTVTSDASKAADKSNGVVPPGATPWDSGLIEGGKSFERTFDTPGEYKYFCIPHEGGGMLGMIVVEG